MEEKVNETVIGQPEHMEASLPPEDGATTPQPGQTDSAFVEVKFNKEIKKLTLDEAATLAQKGMKFELIAKEHERLKALSKSEGLSVTDYLSRIEQERKDGRLSELREKCGGDTELAEKLLSAEEGSRPDEFAELLAEFPELTPDTVPDEVKTAAELRGTGLLFEYLLYDHRLKMAAAEEMSRREETARTSLGSLSSGISRNAADAEFLKGVWGK